MIARWREAYKANPRRPARIHRYAESSPAVFHWVPLRVAFMREISQIGDLKYEAKIRLASLRKLIRKDRSILKQIDLESLSQQLQSMESQSATEKFNEAASDGAAERQENKEAIEAARNDRVVKLEEDRKTHTKMEIWGIVIIVVSMLLIVYGVSQLIPMIADMF